MEELNLGGDQEGSGGCREVREGLDCGSGFPRVDAMSVFALQSCLLFSPRDSRTKKPPRVKVSPCTVS